MLLGLPFREQRLHAVAAGLADPHGRVLARGGELRPVALGQARAA